MTQPAHGNAGAQRACGRFGASLLTLGLLLSPIAAHAQTATITGNLGGFDVVNDTGQEAHGFEIQIEGIQASDLTYTANGQRYGQAVVTPYATGVYIRWVSSYDPDSGLWRSSTPIYRGGPFSWNDCYLAGSRYSSSGCEHFGQSMKSVATPYRVTYRWLVAHATLPGTLVALDRPAEIAAPKAVVLPPTASAAAPVLEVEVEAPDPPDTPEVFGDAQWMKIYKQEFTREVSLDELTSDNALVVPEDPTQIEVDWQLLQQSPPSGGNGNQRRNGSQNNGALGADTRSVVRRIELYKYTGTYDATTHEAICADANVCAAPSPGELGDFVSANNSAVNVLPDSVIVTLVGPGGVSDTTGGIACGNKCAMFATAGSTVTLTANVPNNSAFWPGWSSPCALPNLTTCDLTVSGPTTVTATFTQLFKLSVGNPGSGGDITSTTVTGGLATGIGCGAGATLCQGTVTSGASVTLVATAQPGFVLASWTGACSGASPTCVVTAGRDVSVGARFNAVSTGGGGGGNGGGGGTGSSFTLQIGRSNSGTVTGTPNGLDRALSCGGSCSAKFAPGTVVTLTAAPPAGKTFVSWGGACSGTSTTCAVTMNNNLSVQANFSK